MDDTTRARRAATFDQDPDNYHLGRPGYPPRIYQLLARRCGLRPGTRVLEIGPGTGQATAVLLARGARVVAVEPGPALCARLRREHPTNKLTIIEADLATVALPAGGFDLAVAATSLHWLDPATAIPKIAAAVHPGGWLAAWWTVFGDPDHPPPWRRDLDRLYTRHLPHELDPPGHTPAPLRTAQRSADITTGGCFGPVHTDTTAWEHRLDPAGARRLFATFPNIHTAPPPTRQAFLDDLGTLVAAQPGGIVTDRYLSILYLAPRTTRPATDTTGTNRA